MRGVARNVGGHREPATTPFSPNPTARRTLIARVWWYVCMAVFILFSGCHSEAVININQTGDVTVSVATSGTDPDPDGYTVTVSGRSRRAPSTGMGTLSFTGLPEGDHTVELADVAENCSVGQNPQTVTVVSGSTATANFAVTCMALAGDLDVIVTTTGPNPDPDGYTVTVDGTQHQPVASSGTVTFPGLAVGDHTVDLTGVANNCTVGQTPQTATIAFGSTTTVSFTVTCVAAVGDLAVTVTTTGPDPDPNGYTVTVDGTQNQPVASNGTVTFPGLAVGDHTVDLTGVASNCGVGQTSQTAPIAFASTTTVNFDVTCPPVLVGAGDITDCTVTSDDATADLLDTIAGTVFTAGDNAYQDGTTQEFIDCYEPTWGRHKARTRPSAGNHDYQTPGATGYYTYFGAAAGNPSEGYYSYDLGEWHIVVLNSNIDRTAGSAQITWLVNDLAASTASCTLAYWHHARFSSSGGNSTIGPMWDALYAAGADVVVSSHRHNYERFAPQTPGAVVDPTNGIRQFVVGTGGVVPFAPFGTIHPNSEVRDASTYGVIKFTLKSGSYDWEFIPITGQTFTDSGSGTCH